MARAAGAAASITSPSAILLQREQVRWIEFPGEHTITHHHSGWRVTFPKPCSVRMHLDDKPLKLDLGPEDYILCSGPDIYVSLAPRDRKPDLGEAVLTHQTHKGD